MKPYIDNLLYIKPIDLNVHHSKKKQTHIVTSKLKFNETIGY